MEKVIVIMDCEICGRKIVGRSFKIVLEGSEITVCENCKNYGVEKPKIPTQMKLKPIKKSVKIDLGYELVENFHEIIRREREKRGWSQEELAKRIQEKVSLIRKIENAEITPEPEVVEKLERLFNIKLRESVEEVQLESKKKNLTLTLGDIVVIKKKKK